MVIGYLDGFRPSLALWPLKAYAPLFVDPNGVLVLTVA